jgi:hypothetical protein
MMSDPIVLSLLFAAVFASAGVNAQDKKIDTTASQGAEGYKVLCNNKSASANQISISPKGFGKDIRDMSFTVKGTLRKILVDDFNDDGFPDLVLCIYSGINGEIGTIAGIVSAGKNSLVPAAFPDIYSNPALREGYKGHDAFSSVMGTLMQSFPVYKPGDTDTATGGTRVIQYGLGKAENGGLTFQVLRSYEKKN